MWIWYHMSMRKGGSVCIVTGARRGETRTNSCLAASILRKDAKIAQINQQIAGLQKNIASLQQQARDRNC